MYIVQLVRVRFFPASTGESCPREAYYYTEDGLVTGDVVNVPVKSTITQAATKPKIICEELSRVDICLAIVRR